MLEGLKRLFKMTPPVNYRELVKSGAIIIDVRSKGEFSSGHIKGSINIPVDSMKSQLGKIRDKKKPIITCCASGMRSGMAKKLLLNEGYETVHNGGGWASLERKIG